MNKKTLKVAGWALGLSMAVAGIGAAVGVSQKAPIETNAAIDSNTGVEVTGVSNYQAVTVNGKTAIKAGASKKAGSVSITVASGATKLKAYMASWNGDSTSLSASPTTNISPNSSISLTNDSGISGSGSSFTLSGTEGTYLKVFNLSSITTDTAITFSGGSGKRFVIWDATVKETITYDGNGKTSGSVPTPTKGLMGTDVTLAGNTGSLAKTGYSFNGWNTKADGTGTHYDVEDSYPLSTSAVTLYAEWAALGTVYTVTDDVTDGSLSSTASVLEGGDLSITVSADEHHHLPSDFTVTMEDELFNPVTLTKGTDYTYNSGDGSFLLENVTGNVVISGSCPADNKYTVTYVADSNGDQSESYAVANIWDGDEHTLASLATANLSPKTGYVFSHYDVNGDELQPGDSFEVTANTTVTAVFVEKPTSARYAQSSDSAAALDTASNVDVEPGSPSSVTVTFKNDRSSDKTQMTSGEKQTWTFSGYDGYAIRKIYVNVRNNASSGSGKAQFTYDDKVVSESDTLTGLSTTWTRKSVFNGMLPIATGKTFTIQLSASANSLYCNYVEIEWSEIPTLSRIDVSGTPDKATQYTGYDFDPSGLTFTAVYSDASEFEIDPEDIDWSTLVAGEHPSGTYGGKSVSVESVSVLADAVDHLTATVSKDFYVGETITKSDIVLKQVWAGGKETTVDSASYTFADYDFLFSDAPTGGSTKDNKAFNISYGGKECVLNVNVGRTAYETAEGATKTYNGSGFSGLESSYTTGQTKTVNGTTFAIDGYYYSGQSSLSLSSSKTSAPGSIKNTTAYADPISTVVITGANPDVQVSEDGLVWVDYSTSVTAAGNYYYFKAFYKTTSQSNYVNITKIEVELKGEETARTLADYVMYEDTANQCESKFDVAEAIFVRLSDDEKASFMTSTNHVISTAKARLLAWASHKGKTIELEGGKYVVKSSAAIVSIFTGTATEPSSLSIVIAVSLAGILAMGGIFLACKRRNED